MKLFEKYGQSIAEYEGTAQITAVDTRDQTKRHFAGYFEARQLVDGSLRMGFISTNRPAQPVLDFKFNSSFYEITEIRARDTSGWCLTFEDTSSFPITLLHFANDGPVPNPTIVEFGPRKLKARSRDADPSGYESARFWVTSLLFGGNIPPGEPVVWSKSDEFEVSIIKLPDYESVSGRVGSGGTIEPTVEFLIKEIDGNTLPLTTYAEHMTDLVYLYRLTTGVSVDWCLAEGLRPGLEEGVECIHRAGTTGPRSVDFSKLIPFLRFSAISEAYFSAISEAFQKNNDPVFKRSTIREFIDIFVAACDGRTALELRGLLASTLIDSIVNKYAARKGNEKTAEPNRPCFKRNLQRLSAGLCLRLTEDEIDQIRTVRNNLVHQGTFPSPIQGTWWHDYQLLIWAAFNTLCRLVGYKGDLPPRSVKA